LTQLVTQEPEKPDALVGISFKYGSSISEIDWYLVTSTAFMSKIQKLYREHGDASQKR